MEADNVCSIGLKKEEWGEINEGKDSGSDMNANGLSWKLWRWWKDYKRGDVEVFVVAAAIGKKKSHVA
ncbi:hypothetical protein Tco_0882868 [Tanacetum coccineum]